MRILLSSGVAFRVYSLKKTEELALGLGYDGIELMLPPRHVAAEESNRDTDYQTLNATPIVHAPNDWFDLPRFASALNEAVTVARMIGAEAVNMHPASLFFGGRETVRRAIELIIETSAAAKLPVLYEVLVEPAGLSPERREYFEQSRAYYSLEEWLADVQEFDLLATLDTCHVATWDKDPRPYVEKLSARLRHVHFSDYSKNARQEHLVPGDGDVDLKGFLRQLARTHPDTTLTVEISPQDSAEGVHETAQRSLEYITHVLQGVKSK